MDVEREQDYVTERELKYSTTDEHVPSHAELAAAVAGTGLTLDAPTVERYVDVYFDSAERALVRAGVALRRRHRPSGTYATLKGAGSREGELHSRPELEVRLEQDDAWPEAVLTALPEGAAAAGLAPIAELWVERVRLVARSEGAPVADIAFDAVECRAPGHEGGSVTFNEVEVEALDAGPESDAALRALADAVGTLVPLTPSSHSKLERALALLAAFA